jgi:cadmium resistance protein CadD (predicted permease)
LGVFVLGEVMVTALVLVGGRHPKARGTLARLGEVAVPLLLCAIGVLVMLEAGTFSLV